MEDIHGVDVSWIQSSQPKDRTIHQTYLIHHKSNDDSKPQNASKSPTSTTITAATNDSSPSNPLSKKASNPPPEEPRPTEPVATPPATPPIHKRPGAGLLRRSSKEKMGNSTSHNVNDKNLPRRSSSWISSLSSKLSSSPAASPQPQPSTVNANGHIAQTNSSPNLTRPLSNTPSHTEAVSSVDKPYVPQPPKSGGSSFFSNALRRLSSSSQLGPGAKTAGEKRGMAPRRIMNIDPNRTRCLLPEFDSNKLRRVAFCVDVEIAGGPHYKDEDDGKTKADKDKDRKKKEAAEGQALKNKVVDGEQVVKDEAPVPENPITPVEDTPPSEEKPSDEKPKKEMTRKKEKKKRSEEERKERKEQKRRKAEESGSIPMVISRTNLAAGQDADAAARPLDRPTTDPLRIYRRCCQLRETPVLKRITDQLAASANCPINEPGVVLNLNLTGSRLQLADMVTLSDWLAIVPVKKLILEDSDLNDEGIRVILAGLLAAMTPDFAHRHRVKGEKYQQRSGVVEKLSMRNNPKMTKEGWKHVSLFIYMCQSLKSLDVSMNEFPRAPINTSDPAKPQVDPAEVFAKSISERLGGSTFEELVMSECGLTTHHIRKIVDAVTVSGMKRLGLAGNNIGLDAMEYLSHYIRSGVCEGLDLGSNDLRDHLDILGEAFNNNNNFWALSLADCGLDPASLKMMFPGLLNVQNLRFLDLSHNPELFTSSPSALGLFRKYFPLLKDIRRIHLNGVDMAPNQAIALADILAECPQLAHLSILGNPKLSALASATTEDAQEEAVALYASLMAAVRVSDSIISIDVDVPTAENSEIVKALAKQVVAYSLRNMEKWSAFMDTASSDSASESSGSPSSSYESSTMTKVESALSAHHAKEVEVPEVLLHLVGNYDGQSLPADDDKPTPDNDYIVGGTGVVKALNYCLAEFCRGSASLPTSGAVTPLNKPAIQEKAMAMSKNLLESARKIRTRLEPSLVRESKTGDDMAFRRLLFLDNTLRGIINRFEDEYPECRVPGHPCPLPSDSISHPTTAAVSGADAISSHSVSPSDEHDNSTLLSSSLTKTDTSMPSDSDSDGHSPHGSPPGHSHGLSSHRRSLAKSSRHASDVSLAARAQIAEEGKALRLGQALKRKSQAGVLVGEGLEGEEGGEEPDVLLLKTKLRDLEKGQIGRSADFDEDDGN
ncbi:RNI-like protein [Microthyrium microscopicum]|uniref:RNI-like protein n=1 Tax=Microthyrium microscopicum TaxID=703497 RepID=A0A6A6UC72_9PEZI|nr:RNI-like protein [Microthyrium microscopicum]